MSCGVAVEVWYSKISMIAEESFYREWMTLPLSENQLIPLDSFNMTAIQDN